MERLREALKTRNIAVGTIDAPDPAHFKVEGVPPAQDAAFREVAAEVSDELRPRLRRQRHLHVHDAAERRRSTLREEAVVQARQTIERRVNELGVTEPSIAQQGSQRRSDPRAAARRHRRQPREGDHPLDRPARAEDRRAGAVGDAGSAAGQRPGAAGHGDRARRQRRRRATRARSTTWSRRCAAVTGHGSAQRAAVARREQPAGGELHAEHRRRRASSAR